MSKLCPLMMGVECLGKKCTLAADENGECLIKRLLELQVSKPIKEREMAEIYWATKRDGTRQLVVSPPTEDVLVDCRVLDSGTPEFKPPRYY